MPRMSNRRKRELVFFLTGKGRVAYNRLCLKCTHDCKQSHRSVIIECRRFDKGSC